MSRDLRCQINYMGSFVSAPSLEEGKRDGDDCSAQVRAVLSLKVRLPNRPEVLPLQVFDMVVIYPVPDDGWFLLLLSARHCYYRNLVMVVGILGILRL